MADRARKLRLPRDFAVPRHRAISSLRLPLRRLAGGALIALSFTLVLLWAMPSIALFWSEQMVWWMEALRLPGHFAVASIGEPDPFSLPLPLIDVRLPTFDVAGLAAHVLAALTVWWVAGWLPDHAKPAVYLLRFAVLLHIGSALFFMCWPASFQRSAMSHVGGGLRQSWALMLVTPWLHFFTFYLFPFAAWQDAMLTAVTVLYLLLLAPLQYATHAALLYLAGPVLMPLLYMLFGVMVPILGIIALYGWGMSWHYPAQAGARD